MGCGSSKPAASPIPPPQQQQQAVAGQIVESPAPAPAAGKGGGGGKGKGKGKGKGGGGKWQIELGGRFQDYGPEEDAILKRAYLTGQKNAKFHLRGQNYEYNFKKMIQKNKDTKKERRIRPPRGKGGKPPAKPLLPTGPMIVITVKPGQPGTLIPVKDPNNPGQTIQVFCPAHAKPGAKLAVPVPAKGESVQDVQAKQEKHDKTHGTSTGAKVAKGGAAVMGLAAVGVGGVILGDHLAGGDMAATIGEGAVDAGEWATAAGEDAGEAIAEAAGAVGEWADGAMTDAGGWLADAGAGDAAEAMGDAFDDAGDWLGDAAEDVGDFVMDLF